MGVAGPPVTGQVWKAVTHWFQWSRMATMSNPFCLLTTFSCAEMG